MENILGKIIYESYMNYIITLLTMRFRVELYCIKEFLGLKDLESLKDYKSCDRRKRVVKNETRYIVMRHGSVIK